MPDGETANLYSLNDLEAENPRREVTAVYTNDKPRARDDESSVPGRYVIVQLSRAENPKPQNREAWAPESTAGMAVWKPAGTFRYMFRMDYSTLEIRQNFNATASSGRIVQPAGLLPKLQYEDVFWPEFKGFSIDRVFSGEQGDIHYSYYLPSSYDSTRIYPMVVTLPGYGGLLHSLDEGTRGVNVFTDRSALAWTLADEDVIILAPCLKFLAHGPTCLLRICIAVPGGTAATIRWWKTAYPSTSLWPSTMNTTVLKEPEIPMRPCELAMLLRGRGFPRRRLSGWWFWICQTTRISTDRVSIIITTAAWLR
ncbi:hypothetical protein SPSIL_040330 [Sporomusa silvacetica DSM 10669]|uniref:Esterase Ig-like N-terminal domain-containing protein n=1 Tax=Sporomusa silvacetica DSM 10669 TaxID=1123289 RepID=A0ABZ3IQX6_9FIRM|nr:hypothetical protein SPSIL_33700 [Sporomusa silvacetica DSM 10669]